MTEELELKENERIDDLQYKGLKVIQNNKGFCFGIDSVILSDFAKNIKDNSRVVDLGTGSGVIGLLLCKKTKLKEIIGIEIQKDVANMAKRSIRLNNLENMFQIVNENINDIFLQGILNKNQYDVVVMNPPYKEVGTGKQNEDEVKLISRHEIKAKLSDFIATASNLLKDKGEVYIVHKPERTIDIMQKMRENKIEPKEMKIVYPYKNAEASLILIKGVKGGKKFFKIMEPLYIYENNGEYTEQIKQIYNENN